MPYLTQVEDIRAAITHYTQAKTLWIDTEVADFNTKKPRLSLIQVLDDSTDLTGERVRVLDVLDCPELVGEFIDKIMINPAIEKVFHNASYDCQFLGKRKVKKVTCTLEMVRKIPYYLVPLPNYKLKTLAEELCHFPPVDKSEQGGDWGQRPLTEKQLNYGKMDPVYTAAVHHRLLQLSQLIEPDPHREDLPALTARYREIYLQWKALNTEIDHLKSRLKQGMSAQHKTHLQGFELAAQTRKHKQVSLEELAKVIQASGLHYPVSIRLTQTLQKELSDIVDQLPIQEEIETILQLKMSDMDEDDLPF